MALSRSPVPDILLDLPTVVMGYWAKFSSLPHWI